MNNFISFINKHKVVVFILIISSFLRFWKLVSLFHFTLDEELEAFIVKNIITGYHYPAIGVSVAPIGISLSPLFYYLAAIPFALGKLNPISWGITASLLGVVSTGMIYFSTQKMFTKRIALFTTLFYATSFLMVLYDKHFWNVTPMILVSVLTVLSLFNLLKGKFNWAIVLGGSLSVGLSSHLSTVSLVILVLFVFFYKKISLKNKQIGIGTGLILLSQAPLAIFEIRHNFYQTKALISFFNGPHSGINLTRILDNLELLPKVFSRLIYTFGPHDYAREHTYGIVEIAARDNRIPLIMILLSIFLLLFFILVSFRNRKNEGFFLHFWLLLITIFSLTFYGILFKGNVFEFYLEIVFPTLFLILGIFFDYILSLTKRVYVKTFIQIIILIMVLFNVQATLTAYHSYGLGVKLRLINFVKSYVGHNPYELHSIGVDHKYEGYRYLFGRFYKPPVKSYADSELSWLYQFKPRKNPVKLMVVITSTEPFYSNRIQEEKKLYNHLLKEAQFGEINVMIVQNPKFK